MHSPSTSNVENGLWNLILRHIRFVGIPHCTGSVNLSKVQVVLTLNFRNVADVVIVGKVPTHDKHLRIVDDIAAEQAVRCPLRWWIIRVPFDPFESR
jgi:hypothetical protein